MAIYMYGVAFEIWRAVSASRSATENDNGGNPWTGVLRALQRRTTVDIVAGASAGGINGLLLGRALTCGADLAAARDVWVDKVDMSKLLTRSESEQASLLDSAHMENEFKAALERMKGDPENALVDVLDVFISTTHLTGDARSFEDDLGHGLATRRHDVPVRLRYRDPRRFAAALGVPEEEEPGESDRNDFDNAPLLVQLGRATSAFPVAFTPIKRGEEAEHGFDAWPTGHYTDGGITDNKPFEQALETIFGRAAERPVSRWVLSVNPDPEIPPPTETEDPDFLDVVAAATVAIPRYESIRADLDRLSDHQQRVKIFWEGALEGLEAAIAEGTAGWASDAEYSGLRRAALVSFLVEEYCRARRNSGTTTGRSTQIDDWLRISNALPREAVDWEPLDVAFELRRTYYAIKLLGRQAEAGADTETLVRARQEMWKRFEAMRDACGKAVTTLLTNGALAQRPLLDAVAGVAESPEDLGEAQAAYQGYEQRDRALLLVDPFGFRTPRDEVEHAQIDPVAANQLNDCVPPHMRLAGDTLGHFGGFLERRWRENDILWGRLDTADVLVRALASGSAADTGALIEEVQEEIVRTELDLDGHSDWRAELKASNPAGDEDVHDIPGQRLAVLAGRAGGGAGRMFRSLSPAERAGGARFVRTVLRPLGSALFRLLTPLLSVLALVIGTGHWWVRAAAVIALIPAAGATLYVVIKTASDDVPEFAILVGGWALSITGGYLVSRLALRN